MTTIFRYSLPALILVMALVVGGAWYQTISIVPFWQQDISMFRNYGHWGINYFPILSPLMTVIWLITVVTDWKAEFAGKTLLFVGHGFFLLIMVATFAYFAPFLMTYMGHPEIDISDQELLSMLNTWSRWDFVRQVVGLFPLAIYIYSYGRIGAVAVRKAN